jgi:hypothetical protein
MSGDHRVRLDRRRRPPGLGDELVGHEGASWIDRPPTKRPRRNSEFPDAPAGSRTGASSVFLRPQRSAPVMSEIAGHDLDRRGSRVHGRTPSGLRQPDDAEEAARLRLFGALRPVGAPSPASTSARRPPGSGRRRPVAEGVVAGPFGSMT